MPKLYLTQPGAERRIDRYGVATSEVGVEVPPEVAAEFANHPDYRIEGVLPLGDLGVVLPPAEGGRLIEVAASEPELVVPVAEVVPRYRRRRERKGEE